MTWMDAAGSLTWDEPWEVEGHFHLPEETHTFAGRVEHDPVRGTRAHFIGTGFVRDGRFDRDPAMPVIYGRSLGGHNLTLLRTKMMRWVGTESDIVDMAVGTVVSGPHVSHLNDIRTARTRVTLHGLRDTFCGAWPYGGGALIPKKVGGGGGRWARLTATVAPGVTMQIEAGYTRGVQRGEPTRHDFAHATFELDEPVGYGDLAARYIRPLRDFIALATRRPSYVRSVKAYIDIEDLWGWQVASAPNPPPDGEAVREVQALALNLSQIDDVPALLGRWFELRRTVGPVWTTYFDTLYGNEAQLEGQFLALASFAEGYHRALHDDPPLSKRIERRNRKTMLDALEDPKLRAHYRVRLAHSNSQTQNERISELLERACVTLGWDLDVEQVSREVVQTRNWMVHWGVRGGSVKDDPEELVWLARRLEVAIHVNLLLDTHLDDDAVRMAVGSGWRFTGLP